MFRKCIHLKKHGFTNSEDMLFFCSILKRRLGPDATLCLKCEHYKAEEDKEKYNTGLEEKHFSRQIIDSLQYGIVPPKGIMTLTVGREKEEELILEDLDLLKRSSLVKFVEGDYGVGKTHFLGYIEELSLNRGFAVSRLNISDEHPLDNLILMYRGIIKNLRLPDKREDNAIEWMLRKIGSNVDMELTEQLSDKVSLIIENIWQNPENWRTFIDFLCGYDIPINELRKVGNFPRAKLKIREENFFELLFSIKEMLRYLGYSGLILLVDEFDKWFDSNLGSREEALTNVLYIIKQLRKEAGVYILFAITPALSSELKKAFNSEGNNNFENRLIEIGYLKLNEVIQLAKIIRDIHSKAFDWDPSTVISDELIENICGQILKAEMEFGQKLRRIVKIITLILEIAEQNPDFDFYSEVRSLQ